MGLLAAAGRTQAETEPLVGFRMGKGLAATGRVVDPAGKPMAGVYVQVFGTVHDGQDQVHDCIGLRTYVAVHIGGPQP